MIPYLQEPIQGLHLDQETYEEGGSSADHEPSEPFLFNLPGILLFQADC